MKFIILTILLVYFCAISYLYFFQNSILFNTKSIKQKPDFSLPNTKYISLRVDDGVILDGVYKQANSKNAPLLIYFGGNAGDATRVLLNLPNFDEFDIVVFNYRGYLRSGGKPSEKNLFKDSLKIYDTFKKDRKIILIGRSLGTGVATYLASKREVCGLILITPFDSIVSIAKDNYPMFPVKWILRDKFESTRYMASIENPVAIIEVKDDKTITHKHLLKLKKSVKNLIFSAVLDETTHADVLKQKDFEKTLKKAVKKMLKSASLL